MDLDWCEVVAKRFGGKYGGYISDNFMAVGRILPWLYSSLLILHPQDPYVEPLNDVSKWRIKDCTPFLKLRGIQVPRGVKEQRLAVILEKNKPFGEQLPIIEIPTCSPGEVYECVVRLYLLVSLLFQEQINRDVDPNMLHVVIRLFLSSFDRLDMATRVSRTTQPRWLSSYNFLCLLNIPETVRGLGPYRNIYEGKYCGEGFNRILKPTANRTSHRNRSLNLLRNLHREKAMGAVQCHSDLLLDPVPRLPAITNRSRIYRMAHRYKNKEKAEQHYHRIIPISVLVYRTDTDPVQFRRYGMCFLKRCQVLIAPLVRDPESETVVGGWMTYWKFTLFSGLEDCLKIELLSISDYGILLPLTSDPSRIEEILPRNYYTITTHKWNSEQTIKL
jgi:hypothetical protein